MMDILKALSDLPTIPFQIAALLFAGSTAVLGIRVGGIRSERDEYLRAANHADTQLITAREELSKMRTARDTEVNVLRAKLSTIRGTIAALSDTPSSRALVLTQLDGLLSSKEIQPRGSNSDR